MTGNIGSLRSALPYEAGAPLRPEIERTEEELDTSSSWIRYDGARRRRVTAVLVEPVGDGPFAGLVFLHPFSGDKMYFLGEAKQLAAVGIASLLIEVPHKRPAPHRLAPDTGDPGNLRAYYLQTIGDVRRGYDLLEQLDGIDAERLGYVGQAEGADLAAAISALEPRLGTVVCIEGVPRASLYWRNSQRPAAIRLRAGLGRLELKQHIRALEEFDACPLIKHTHAGNWLLQFAGDDGRADEEEIQRFRKAFTGAVEVQRFPQDRMTSVAETHRRRWLQTNLRPGWA